MADFVINGMRAVMAHVIFVLMNVLACTISYQLARLFLWDQPNWLRWLAVISAFPLVALFAIILTNTLFGLDARYLLGVLTLASAALTVRIWSRNFQPVSKEEPKGPAASQEFALQHIAWGLFAAFAGVLAVRAVWNGTSFFSDDYGYHATAVAHWIIHRDLSTPAYNFAGYYSLNGELFALWFCIALLQDAWAVLSPLYWILLTAFTAVAITSARNQNLSSGLLVGAMLLCSPLLGWLATKTFAGIDVAIAGSLVAAILLSLSPEILKSQSSTMRTSCVAYGGLLAGFAVGCKVSVAPGAAIILAALTWAHFRTRSYTKTHLVLFVSCCLIGGGYWFTKNWITTGNPIFPVEFGPFAGPFTSSTQADNTLVTLAASRGASANFWLDMAWSFLNWPIGLGLLSIAGYASALSRQCRQIGSGQRSADSLLVQTLLLTGLTLAVIHPFMPFSNGAGNTDASPFVPRYITPTFVIGLILFSNLLDQNSKRRWFWWTMAVVSIITTWPVSGLSAALAIIAAAVGLAVWTYRERFFWPPVTYALGLGVLFTGLSILTNHQQNKTNLNLLSEGDREHPIGIGWSQLEQLPAGSKLAYFSNMPWHIYPAFGRSFQLRPLFLKPDGAVPEPLHEAFAKDSNLSLTPTGLARSAAPDAAQLKMNLLASGAEFVFVTRWNTKEWPAQYHLIGSMSVAEKIYDDGYSALWKLTPTRTAE